MVTGLPKFSGKQILQRASSPKLQVMNTALMTAPSRHSFEAAKKDRDFWGHLVESAIGAHLVNTSMGTKVEVFYWRERNKELDFVLRLGREVAAIEVKSGRRKESLSGMDAFSKAFRPKRKLLVGSQGIPVEEFLRTPAVDWI